MLMRISGLTVAYGSIRALDAVTMGVHKGEVLSIIGANGAGKSTLLRAVAGLLVVALTVPAQNNLQDSSSWDAVMAIGPGSDVRVASAGRTVRGKWQGATGDALTIDIGNGPVIFPRPQVMAVWVRANSHHGRNALIGAAIGAGVGAGIGAGIDPTTGCSSGCLGPTISRGLAAGIAAGLLGAIGALVGAVIPSGWHKAYAR